MPNDGPSAALTFYPAYCFSASPTYNTWVKLSAADVHALKQRPGYEGQRLYFHLNHPIRYIRLVGLITSFDPSTSTTQLTGGPSNLARTTRTPYTFTLDDGSGSSIPVLCWPPDLNSAPRLATYPGELCVASFADLHSRPARTVTGKDVHLDEVELGKVVKVKGWVDEFRGSKQVLLERVSVVRDTREEVGEWLGLAQWQREVLGKPWVLGEGELRSLREREERRRRKAAGLGERREKMRRAGAEGRGAEEAIGRVQEVSETAGDEVKRDVDIVQSADQADGDPEVAQPKQKAQVAPEKVGDDAERAWAAFELDASTEDCPEAFQRRHRIRVVPAKKTSDNASRSLTPAERPRPQANIKAARKHQGS